MAETAQLSVTDALFHEITICHYSLMGFSKKI
jgi:hypothetical protein